MHPDESKKHLEPPVLNVRTISGANFERCKNHSRLQHSINVWKKDESLWATNLWRAGVKDEGLYGFLQY